MLIRKLINWLSVKDYDEAKKKSAVEVANRYSRGKVSIQNVDQKGLSELSEAGDRAMDQIAKKVSGSR